MRHGLVALLGCALLLAGTARADDIVVAFQHVKMSGGGYVATDRSHLFRLSAGGRVRQLTFGPEDDSDPCLAPDKSTILFWRRPALDSVGGLRLCSISPDGSHFRVIRRFDDLSLDDPTGAARSYRVARRYVPMILGKGENEELRLIRRGSGAGRDPVGLFSPSGRYEFVDWQADTRIYDLDRGKSVVLPGIPSHEGPGTASPISVGWLTDDSLIYGFFYENRSRLAIATVRGRKLATLWLHEMKHGKPVFLNVVGSDQWWQNPGGVKAFRLRHPRRTIVLQEVGRDDTGGNPTIYFIRGETGEVKRQIHGQFLQDVDSSGEQILTSDWAWGKPADGGLPLGTLHVWKWGGEVSGSPGPKRIASHGACFVPSAPQGAAHR